MTAKTRHRLHAARVATAATAVVVAAYALCAFGLSVFVAHRLLSEADARITPVLTRAAHLHLGSSSSSSPSALPGESTSSSHTEPGNGDLDDAPIFLWRVRPGGTVQALTVGAPALPVRRWSASPATVRIGSSPFRVEAVRTAGGWLVGGQSVADVARVRSALALPEVLFGLLLALATFAGSLIVGLRASAPLDIVRRRQAEFTADASHELRTPLSVVEAEVDLALRRRRAPEEYEAVLRRIAGESRRLRRIVDDLLWLARADGPDQVTGRERADLVAVAEACVERFGPVAERLGIALSFTREGHARDGTAATVQASPELVERLCGVLVDNACKYAGQEGAVTVAVRSSGSRAALRVDDSGPGIPPEQRQAVFDRFHRATDSGEGAGLGLAIADTIVRMTGGTWVVGDSPLGGALMEVSWRRVPGEDAASGRPPRHEASPGPGVAPAVSSGAGGPVPGGNAAPARSRT